MRATYITHLHIDPCAPALHLFLFLSRASDQNTQNHMHALVTYIVLDERHVKRIVHFFRNNIFEVRDIFLGKALRHSAAHTASKPCKSCNASLEDSGVPCSRESPDDQDSVLTRSDRQERSLPEPGAQTTRVMQEHGGERTCLWRPWQPQQQLLERRLLSGSPADTLCPLSCLDLLSSSTRSQPTRRPCL